jgi:riboflavin transporter FmnP
VLHSVFQGEFDFQEKKRQKGLTCSTFNYVITHAVGASQTKYKCMISGYKVALPLFIQFQTQKIKKKNFFQEFE